MQGIGSRSRGPNPFQLPLRECAIKPGISLGLNGAHKVALTVGVRQKRPRQGRGELLKLARSAVWSPDYSNNRR